MRRQVGVAETTAPRAWTFDGRRVAVEVDPRVFSPNVAVRAAYTLIDRAWVFVHTEGDQLAVVICPKDSVTDLDSLIGELGNALIDARIRAEIQQETMAIHEAIVAEAFSPVRERRG